MHIPEKFTLTVERGKEGLWYVTSPEIPGLLVAEQIWPTAIHKTAKAIGDLTMAANDLTTISQREFIDQTGGPDDAAQL